MCTDREPWQRQLLSVSQSFSDTASPEQVTPWNECSINHKQKTLTDKGVLEVLYISHSHDDTIRRHSSHSNSGFPSSYFRLLIRKMMLRLTRMR